MAMLLRRMKADIADLSGLGVRNYRLPHEVCEMAWRIQSTIRPKRPIGGLFEKRHRLMIAWAGYCATPKTAKILPLRKQALG
jgi:hypothetical protein